MIYTSASSPPPRSPCPHTSTHTHTHTLVNTTPSFENQAFSPPKVCPVAEAAMGRYMRPIKGLVLSLWPLEPSLEAAESPWSKQLSKKVRTCQIGERLAPQSRSHSAEQMSPPILTDRPSTVLNTWHTSPRAEDRLISELIRNTIQIVGELCKRCSHFS